MDDLLLTRALRWEKESPDRIWLVQPMGGGRVREITWKEAIGEARRMAAHLASHGFPPGSRIGILSKNSAHFMMADLAIWMAGYVSVALYPTLGPDTVRYILEHSGAKLLFVGKLDAWETMKPGVPDIPRISTALSPPNDYPRWEEIVARTEPLAGEPARGEDETAILVYTSGSTGQPKGVVHTFGTIAAACRGFETVLDWGPTDRVLSYLPLAHIFERAVIEAVSIHQAVRVYFAESLDTFAADLVRARPTFFHSVPRLWLKFQEGVFRKLPREKLRRLLRIPILSGIVKRKILRGLGLDACRMAVSGSAPMPPALLQWYRDLGLELLEGYAMTENFSYSNFSKPGFGKVGSVGHALPGVSVRISNEGEIQVQSPANMKGYFEEPALTAAAFTADGYLKTGDRGSIDPEGRLTITGRVKELFKTSKGKYVAPVPIENVLNADEHVELTCVTGADEPQPFALVVLAERLRQTLGTDGVRREVGDALARLRDQVNAGLDPHEHLAFLAVVREPWLVENGLLTPSLKIKREPLESRYRPKWAAWYAARTPVVWEE
jgi:long-subunit acyl-CoA synthetase (AMP-forming)